MMNDEYKMITIEKNKGVIKLYVQYTVAKTLIQKI